ncbi:MAG: DMT family transporter [Christensenellales bacterium]|jgi:drug/metabolite transporter (DMT)-like permease
MNSKTGRLTLVLLLIAVSAVWGMGFSIVKLMLDHGTPVFLLVAIRFIVGALSLLCARPILKSPPISKNEVYSGAVISCVLLTAFVLQSYAAKYTTPSKNGMLTGVYVIFTALLSIALFRKKAVKPLADASVCIVGMFIFFEIFSENMNMNAGDLLSLGAALFFAIHFILLEKESHKYDSTNFTFVQLAGVGIMGLILSVITERQLYVNIEMPYFILGALFLGVFSTGFAYLMQTFTQAHIKATTVSTILCSESVFAVIFSLMLGYEQFNKWIAIGGAIIFLSILSSVFIQPGKNHKQS